MGHAPSRMIMTESTRSYTRPDAAGAIQISEVAHVTQVLSHARETTSIWLLADCPWQMRGRSGVSWIRVFCAEL